MELLLWAMNLVCYVPECCHCSCHRHRHTQGSYRSQRGLSAQVHILVAYQDDT